MMFINYKRLHSHPFPETKYSIYLILFIISEKKKNNQKQNKILNSNLPKTISDNLGS